MSTHSENLTDLNFQFAFFFFSFWAPNTLKHGTWFKPGKCRVRKQNGAEVGARLLLRILSPSVWSCSQCNRSHLSTLKRAHISCTSPSTVIGKPTGSGDKTTDGVSAKAQPFFFCLFLPQLAISSAWSQNCQSFLKMLKFSIVYCMAIFRNVVYFLPVPKCPFLLLVCNSFKGGSR